MEAKVCNKPFGESSIGVFFVSDDLRFQQNYCDYSYDAEFSSSINVKKYFKAKKGQVLNIVPFNNAMFGEVLIVGIGKAEDITQDDGELIGSKLVHYLSTIEAKDVTICFNLPDNLNIKHQKFIDRFYQGLMVRNYKFNKYFEDKKSDHQMFLNSVTLCYHDAELLANIVSDRTSLFDGLTFARDLVSEPGNILFPEKFTFFCKILEQNGVKITVLDKQKIIENKMNALLGVSQGSCNEPYVVIMEYIGNNQKSDFDVALVGKGVTFDSGGISIKPAQNMGDMKYDMAGAASVVGAMKTLSQRGAKVNVVGIVGLVENMPSGTAQRPGDVVVSMSGKTIEIDNTDAEGRLVLADILCYVQNYYKPGVILNFATLTGAIVVALGEGVYAGLFSNDDELAAKLCNAGIASGEKVWRMPMCEKYDKQINSDIADVKNTGNGRGAGSITAAQFLQRFVDQKTPWAHLDIAGMAWEKSGLDVYPKGATGFGVRLINAFIDENYG